MKKVKTIIIAFTLILSGFLLGACGSNVIASQDWPLKIWFQNRNISFQYFVFDWMEGGLRSAYQITGILKVLQEIRGWQGAGTKYFTADTGKAKAQL